MKAKAAVLFEVLVVVLLVVPVAHADKGLVMKKSAHSVARTLDRMEKIVREKGATVFARIDHAKGAKSVGVELRPTGLLIFGNPTLGSQLLAGAQTVGIDLPMKVLAWQDGKGQVWIGYNDPQYIAQRHAIKDRAQVVEQMRATLDGLTSAAAAP